MRNTPSQIEEAILQLIEYQVKILRKMETLKSIEKSAGNPKKLDVTQKDNSFEHQKHLQTQYEKLIEDSLLLSIKEKRVLNIIDCFPYELEKVYIPIFVQLENYVPEDITEDQIYQIKSRLSRIVGQKVEKLTNKYEECMKEYQKEPVMVEGAEFFTVDFSEFYGNDKVFDTINTQIEIKRIMKLQEFIDKSTSSKEKEEIIDEKFALMFENKEILDRLLEVKMNPYFMLETPDDVLAEFLNMKEKTFKSQKENQYMDNISDFIETTEIEGFKKINDIKKIVDEDCELSFIYLLLCDLSTKFLVKYLQENQDSYNDTKEKKYLLAINMINDILNKRNDYGKVSSELLDNFISLIKLAELIVNQHKILCDLEKQDLKDTKEFEETKKQLKTYLQFENDILDNFSFTTEESYKLTDILEGHLGLLLKDEKNCPIVKKRIGNMLPDLIDDFSTVAYEDGVSYMIHQTFVLKTLKIFEGYIKKQQNQKIKEKLIEEKYLQCCYHKCVNDDIINTNFESLNVIISDDESIAELLDVRDFEYSYDKNIELYAIGSALIYELVNNKTYHPNHGYTLYRKIGLKEVLENLNDENILGLENQYNVQMRQNKKSEKVEGNFQIKKIFKKVKPKYL